MNRFIEALIGVLIGVVLVTSSYSNTASKTPSAYYPVEVHRVLDGDTINATIHLGWDVDLAKQDIRLLDYDAWETSRRRHTVNVTDDELVKGQLARQELASLLATGTVYVSAGPEARDNYGRPLAALYVVQRGNMVVVSDYMKSRGHQRK